MELLIIKIELLIITISNSISHFLSKVVVLTSIEKSGSCAHSPLALVHTRRYRTMHLHTDISHFLRV